MVVSTPAVWPYSGWPGCLAVPGAQRLEVLQLQAPATEVELDVEGQAGVAAGEHEPVPSRPVRVGRVVPHHLLEQQVRRGREAHGGAGVPVAHLLHGIHGQDANGVDCTIVELGPVEAGICGHVRGVLSSASRFGFEPSPQLVVQVTPVGSWAGRLRRYAHRVCTPFPFDDPLRCRPGPAKARPRDRARLRGVRARTHLGYGERPGRRGCLRGPDQAPRDRAAAADHRAGDVLRPARGAAVLAGGRHRRRRDPVGRQRERAELRLRPRHRRADAPHPAPRAAAPHRHAAVPPWSSGWCWGSSRRWCSASSSTGSRPGWRSRRVPSTSSATRWC